MDTNLARYIDRVRPAFPGIPRDAAHQIAFAFLSFKLGIYNDAATRCEQALKLVEGRPLPGVLGKALSVVRERATALSQSQYDTRIPFLFAKEDLPFGIIDPKEPVADADLFQLTDALVLLYAVALAASPDDEQALEEQEKFILQLLATYRKTLNK